MSKIYNIDFSEPTIGEISYQGEHKISTLVFELPEKLREADFINAEFVKANGDSDVVDQLIPENNTVIVRLTQNLIDVTGVLQIQLVAYKVLGEEIVEIAKSPIVRGVVTRSLNVLYNTVAQGVIERIIAFIHEWFPKLPIMWAEKHTHDNKALLDTITPDVLGGEQADWNENDATKKSHIKNRTHWREVSDNAETITFIGSGQNVWGNKDSVSYDLTGSNYRVVYNGNEYELKSAIVFSVVNGTYLGVDNVTVCRYAIGNHDLATQEYIGTFPPGYEPSENDFPFCFTYEVVTEQGDTYTLSELVTFEVGELGSELTFDVAPITYHTLSDYYLSEDVQDAAEMKHTHANKDLLDSLTADDVGIKPDWDENNEQNKGYIANRTHWAENSIVSNDYTVDWLAEAPPYSPQNWDSWNLGIELAEGIEYTLAAVDQTITGECTRIEVEAQTGSQVHLILGNLYYLNGLLPSGETYEDSGFPMLLDFATENGDNLFNLVLTDSDYFGSDLSFSIGKEETVYHPVDINYLPESAKDAVEMKHTHNNKTILDDFAESNGILQYDGHAVPQFPINNVEPTTLSDDYTVPWLKPNVWHRFGSADLPVRSISILELEPVDNAVAEEYIVEFWTGATAPSPVIFPLYVEWPDGSEPMWAANKHYQVSIVNNVGLWCESEEVDE